MRCGKGWTEELCGVVCMKKAKVEEKKGVIIFCPQGYGKV